MHKRSYWYFSPRGFANEYVVGIATSPSEGRNYKQEGFDRIDRDRAIRELRNNGGVIGVYVTVSIDGSTLGHDRFVVARALKKGQQAFNF
jgi:hypothetical protein